MCWFITVSWGTDEGVLQWLQHPVQPDQKSSGSNRMPGRLHPTHSLPCPWRWAKHILTLTSDCALSACSLARTTPTPWTSLYRMLGFHVLVRLVVKTWACHVPLLPFSFPNFHLLSYWPLLGWVYLSLFVNSVGKSSQELCFRFVQTLHYSMGRSSVAIAAREGLPICLLS